MPSSRGFSPQNCHTVVLQPRGNRASQYQNISLKQRHYPYARGSPPQVRSKLYQRPTHPPPQNTGINPPENIYTQNDRTDLLVRFGIDSTLGRVLARVLVFLLLTQPVYVAMGMELEDTVVNLGVLGQNMIEESGVIDENVQGKEEREFLDTINEQVTTETIEKNDANDSEQVIIPEEMSTESLIEGDVLGDTTTSSDEKETSESTFYETETVPVDTVLDASDTGNVDDGVTESEDSESDNGTTLENIETDDTITDTATNENSDSNNTETNDAQTEENSSDSQEEESDTDESFNSEDAENIIDNETQASETGMSASSTASTTQKTTEEIVNIAQNPQSKYVFGEGDCTLVSDGEFYCVAEGPKRQQMMGERRVYSEKDREGDREIFYFDGVEIKRITNNSYDDFAPSFDEETLRIVWQAMLNDRLQIMMHDLTTNTTRQITTTRQNSSNPNIAGDTVVWQEWIGTNWEIMMTNIDNNGQEFEIEQLTDNAVHDMFPTAYDGLITWQREKGSSWEVVVYDLRTGKKKTLEKSENTKYENPRFVLLFDSKHENGDIETIGYNLDTGEMMELGTKSQPIPENPLTPKEETQDALVREATSTTQIKIEGDDESGDDDTTDTPLI